MAITRTIYTQSKAIVILSSTTSTFSTVQNATYTTNLPKQDVTVFGQLGSVQRVQVEPESASIEFTFVPRNAGQGGTLASEINGLMQDAMKPGPTRSSVNVPGIGAITGAILSSIAGDIAVGAIPTITLSFEGMPSGVPAAGTAATTTASITVATPSGVTVGALSCAQSAAVAWDLPVDRIMCLSLGPNAAEAFGQLPGTSSITAEGTQTGSKVTGVALGHFSFGLGANAEVESMTNNLAVGELFGTFNVVTSDTAGSCTVNDV